MQEIKITILYDDLDGVEPGYIKSFGFSALLEVKNKIILFDTATKEDILIENLTNFGITPSSIDAVILSHNHYDHTDGLPAILKSNENLPVFVHKHWEKPVRHKGISVPPKNKFVVKEGGQFKELGEKVYITNAFMSPDYGGIYEHACYVRTNDAYILICGCCHPGLLDFLKDRESLGIPVDTPLYIIGGLHGFEFTDKEAQSINPYIRSIIICHCTKNTNVYKEQFGEKCTLGIVGKTLKF